MQGRVGAAFIAATVIPVLSGKVERNTVLKVARNYSAVHCTALHKPNDRFGSSGF